MKKLTHIDEKLKILLNNFVFYQKLPIFQKRKRKRAPNLIFQKQIIQHKNVKRVILVQYP
jgi:hypothetical protein